MNIKGTAPQLRLQKHIYGFNINSLRTRGTICVKYQSFDGEWKHRYVNVAQVGYDSAVAQAKITLQDWLREDIAARKVQRIEKILENPAISLARADVNLAILRFGWKEIDGYWGRSKHFNPIQLA